MIGQRMLFFYCSLLLIGHHSASSSSSCDVHSLIQKVSDVDESDVDRESKAGYKPGDPGAAWTEEEQRIMRTKIRAVIEDGKDLYDDLGLKRPYEFWTSAPNAAKLLRLGFHDCLRYEDGTGGCDGCLEWDGVGVRYQRSTLGKNFYPPEAADDGHNNGLGPTVQVLERIYTDGSFPSNTESLAVSPNASGKSRADVWAFAVLVAVNYAVDFNNKVCGDYEYYSKEKRCHPRAGQPDCKVVMPRPFVFKTGRRDCQPTTNSVPFGASKVERHPNPSTNGIKTVEFFQNNFGFNGRETVAIMGAHTLGGLHSTHSLYRYKWKTNSASLFNNGYFRNIALKRDWYFPTEAKKPCKVVGDTEGKRPIARWTAKVRDDLTTGGPVQWLQEKLICNNFDRGSNARIEAANCSEKDLKWRFVRGKDETALSCELGLYLDFAVDKNGHPWNCTGLERFNPTYWKQNKKWKTSKNVQGRDGQPDCPLQTLRSSDGTPLYEIVEQFASDSASWLEVFVPTLEKMLENGYGSGDLKKSFDMA